MGQQRSISVLILFALASGFNNVSHQAHGIDLFPTCVDGPGTTNFHIYNSLYPNGTMVDIKSKDCTLLAGKPLYVTIHGWTGTPFSVRWLTLVRCLVNKFGVNVLVVDWRNGSCSTGGIDLTQELTYPYAVKNVEPVGVDVAKFLVYLKTVCGVNLTETTLIGHSLGSHVGAACSKYLQKYCNIIVLKFWALDPAGPLFESKPCSNRTCITDASCVIVIHTSLVFGMHKAIGKLDCYMNGGDNQPGCRNVTLVDRPSCSHSSAIEYLIHIFCGYDCNYVAQKWSPLSLFPPTSKCTASTCFTLSITTPCQSPYSGTYYVDTTNLSSKCVSFSQSYPTGLGLQSVLSSAVGLFSGL